MSFQENVKASFVNFEEKKRKIRILEHWPRLCIASRGKNCGPANVWEISSFVSVPFPSFSLQGIAACSIGAVFVKERASLDPTAADRHPVRKPRGHMPLRVTSPTA